MSHIENDIIEANAFQWTTPKVIQSILVFAVAGVAEIFGGWMVWAAVRGNSKLENDVNGGKKAWWYALLGSIILILYGFIPCFQPSDSFGRIYAVYGGFFIAMSFLFGWLLDGDRPDLGDIVGSSIALIGVLVVMFWPR